MTYGPNNDYGKPLQDPGVSLLHLSTTQAIDGSGSAPTKPQAQRFDNVRGDLDALGGTRTEALKTLP